ncbi:CYFA0S14e02344g1_1 [Cyberlindnera fabianii]|uniref:CYFA0S14e02344g1_1 n=1 Tax=Cyberlindnera fabianii TaxID=36022 RepID=A0A061B909_CYBFA|nr:putative urea active transporter 2 [Cyberlindnera fabianii]CDR44373.1 CYFA0S14e02344g1_1 [Cyberlindnera fabianii]
MGDYILSQGIGYGYIVGLGSAFALIMVAITYTLAKYMNQMQNSERFTTAARSVNSGLISSAVVSSWIWPASLLTSGLWGYTYGISGGYLYGVSGTTQIFAFALLAIEIKRIAPACHTIAEIIKARYDKPTHWVYMFYITATNTMVASCLLLGASQGFNASTGINIIAANFLLPLGVCIYTATGGLKATFISDWIHTVIIYIVVLILCFKVFCTSDIIGSPGKMWDMLQEVQEKFPSTSGSNYLSFRNPEMFMTTWSVCVGGFGSVFGDPSYGQKAIAASPSGVLSGYIIGGLCWLTIPWALGTAGGLAARAMLIYPGFQTYPNELSSSEASAGLPVIYAYGAILGKSGAAAAVLTLFMSVTSAMSAELIAFSSVATFDVYRGYINPAATGSQLVRFSHLSTMGFSLVVACVSIIFNYVGVSVGWLIGFYGIILVPAVSVLTYSLYWKKTSSFACTYGPPASTLIGIACWIGSAQAYHGAVDKATLMTSEPSIIGNFVSLGSSLLLIPLLTYIKPNPEGDFDFTTLQTSFKAGDDADDDEIKAMVVSEEEQATLKKASKIAITLNIILMGGGYLIVPLCFYGTDYTFSKKYFTQWVIIMMICLFIAGAYIIIFPLYQGRHDLMDLFRAIKAGKPSSSVNSGEVNSSSDEAEMVQVEGQETKVTEA